jgi:UDP-galactopyranose mutase
MEYDLCIVGAGLSGSTIARLAAEDGYTVLVIDKRDHIGGNVYDKIDDITQIRISLYGAHLFHTNDEGVWKFVNRFGLWTPWYHKVVAECSGQLVPVPVNITTVNMLFDQSITNEGEMKEWLSKEAIACAKPSNSEEVALSRVGKRLYDKLFKPYTFKQWAKHPIDLEPSVLERIPVRTDFDDRYFTCKYQALPINGYTSIVKSMLDHPNISVKLKCPWTKTMKKVWKKLVFTGPIDAYFSDAGLNPLEYRSIKFDWQRIPDVRFFQQNSVINYPSSSREETRCVEYKHFLNQESNWTILATETTSDKGEPYYPVPTKENRDLYEKYRALASSTDVHFVGRLASYKYFNMDQAIRNAMDYYTENLK